MQAIYFSPFIECHGKQLFDLLPAFMEKCSMQDSAALPNACIALKKKNTTHCHISTHKHNYSPHVGHCHYFLDTCDHNYLLLDYLIVSAARSLTCRDDCKMAATFG